MFTFGMQHWNNKVDREDCISLETQFVSYRIDYSRHSIREIEIVCSNGQKYPIDGSTVTSALKNDLYNLTSGENCQLLIHPNSNTILEMKTENHELLSFDEAISKLGNEATGFLFLGIFMYFASLVGLYYVVLHTKEKIKSRPQAKRKGDL